MSTARSEKNRVLVYANVCQMRTGSNGLTDRAPHRMPHSGTASDLGPRSGRVRPLRQIFWSTHAGVVLVAQLAAVRVKSRVPELASVHAWLDYWSGPHPIVP